MMRTNRIVLCVVLVVFGACGLETADKEQSIDTDPAYLAEIEDWRAQRYERLRRPDGWLSLAGLFWLEEGENSFGSGSKNALNFPPGAPADMGMLVRTGTAVTLQSAPGVAISSDGVAVDGISLVSDVEGSPTVLTHGSLSFYVIERGNRVGVRVKDSASELLSTFTGIDHYDVDRAWRIEARFEPYEDAKEVVTPNIIGDDLPSLVPGVAVFEIGGKEFRLEPVGDPADEMFFVFGDETNGDETYGAGRFLYAGPPESNGRLMLDFNKAYNPPCVFTAYATCPLPRPDDKVALRITAGEKNFSAGLGALH